MDYDLQIQGIKSQLENMKLQLESIEMQNSNLSNLSMMMNPTGDQLLNLSIQMLNTGLQTFNIGSNLSMNADKFYSQLKKISEKINIILNSNQMILQNAMEQQQQMFQQQFLMNQILQQQMMEQQIREEEPKINVILESYRGKVNFIVNQNITFEELYYKYMDKLGKKDLEIYFLVNGYMANKYDKKKIKDILPGNLVRITVVDK